MFNTNILTFEIATRLSHNQLLYTTDNHQTINVCFNNQYFSIHPSFTITYRFNNPFLNLKERSVLEITDLRIRIDITEMKIDLETNKLTKQIYSRNTSKTFNVNNDLFELISKLHPFIRHEIFKNEFTEQKFIIDFTNISNYAVIENSNNYTTEQISDFLETLRNSDLINMGHSILLYRTLTNFKEELSHSLNENEHFLSAIFKKYEKILPLVILGVDSVLIFEYEIINDTNDPTIPDILFNNENNQIVNLIELKRADAKMFNSSNFRNNTLRIKPEFSNAIHQTNVQRTMMAISSNEYQYAIPKSILIYGSLNNEVERLNVDRDHILKNLNILRYNNKDLTIITYDELLERVELIINNSGQSDT